tara:strand:- start:6442 stop:6786 length:345 start_codon:yes stop_codon:yes gene_type:complete
MSITKILGNKELESSVKLTQVAEIIGTLRKSYGNSDSKIPSVKVNTTHGNLPFEHLEDNSKVEILLNEALNIKATAIADVEANPGVMLNKKVEEMLATSPLFANASAETEFDVL